jgi:hypothetical protein
MKTKNEKKNIVSFPTSWGTVSFNKPNAEKVCPYYAKEGLTFECDRPRSNCKKCLDDNEQENRKSQQSYSSPLQDDTCHVGITVMEGSELIGKTKSDILTQYGVITESIAEPREEGKVEFVDVVSPYSMLTISGEQKKVERVIRVGIPDDKKQLEEIAKNKDVQYLLLILKTLGKVEGRLKLMKLLELVKEEMKPAPTKIGFCNYCDKEGKIVATWKTKEGWVRTICEKCSDNPKQAKTQAINNERRKVMVCCQCGAIDDSYSAYCGRCGRVPHTVIEIDKKTASVIFNAIFETEFEGLDTPMCDMDARTLQNFWKRMKELRHQFGADKK